jgi:hypothetical protein
MGRELIVSPFGCLAFVNSEERTRDFFRLTSVTGTGPQKRDGKDSVEKSEVQYE